MSIALRTHARTVVIGVAVFALALAVFLVGTTTVGATGNGDGLFNEGIVCFESGDISSAIVVGGRAGYDITDGTLGFATVQGRVGLGANVSVCSVALNVNRDRVTVYLNKPAARRGCAAWHLTEQEFFG